MIVKWHGWLCMSFFSLLWAGLSAHFQAMPNSKVRLLSHIFGSTCILFNPYVTEGITRSLCSCAIKTPFGGLFISSLFDQMYDNDMVWLLQLSVVFQMLMIDSAEQTSDLYILVWLKQFMDIIHPYVIQATVLMEIPLLKARFESVLIWSFLLHKTVYVMKT